MFLRALLRGEVPADLRALRVERSRDFGECYLALSLWHRLGLDTLLAELLPADRESVGWAHAAALLTVARFCAQRSELGFAEHWYDTTALDDLLGVDSASVNDDRLFRALDQLGAHKDALCAHLMTRYRQWFGGKRLREHRVAWRTSRCYARRDEEDNERCGGRISGGVGRSAVG